MKESNLSFLLESIQALAFVNPFVNERDEIENKKPVMCYGLPEYNHLINYENIKIKKNQQMHFKKNNLKLIEDCLQKKFIFNNFPKRNLDKIY